MANTIFVLGAGASKQAGVPLMGDFLDVARGLWRGGSVVEHKSSFDIVFDGISKLQQVHSKSQLDIQNVESVFAAFEMAKILSKFADYAPEQIDSFASAMKSVIMATIQESFKIPFEEGRVAAPSPYPTFARLVQDIAKSGRAKQPVAVITFNYDMALDLAFHLSGTPIRYGLEDSERPDALPLLKLHGSLNWARCSCGRIVPWYLSDYLSSHNWDGVPSGARTVKLTIASRLKSLTHEGHSVGGELMIVPPTWNKSDHHAGVSRVWSLAAKELSDAENIVVIGYSLPPSDMFFRLLYALGSVGSATLNKFWVINPDSTGRVRSRFGEMLGPGAVNRFQYFESTFDECLHELRGKLLRD